MRIKCDRRVKHLENCLAHSTSSDTAGKIIKKIQALTEGLLYRDIDFAKREKL